MNESDNEKKIPQKRAIEIIDFFLSKGWTSFLDIALKFENEFGAHFHSADYNSKELYYKEVKQYHSGYIRRMIDVVMPERYTFVKNGVKAHTQKKDLFIDTKEVKKNDLDSIGFELSDANKQYFKVVSQGISVYKYTDSNFSIMPYYDEYDNNTHENNLTARRFKKEIIESFGKTRESYGDSLSPQSEDIKKQGLALSNLGNKLKSDTYNQIKKRLTKVDILKNAKPLNWIGDIISEYREAFEAGQNVIDASCFGNIALQYGSFLMDINDFQNAQSVFEKSLRILESPLLTGDYKAKEQYALILQKLAWLNIVLVHYDLAEKEMIESLDIFRELTRIDMAYEYGIAASLCGLAQIHMEQRMFDSVEKDYQESLDIYNRLSNSEPAKYIDTRAECFRSIGHYYMLIGKIDKSVAAYENALSVIGNLTNDNLTLLGLQKAKVLVDYSSALISIGDYLKNENLLKEAIHILNQLNINSVNGYKGELATAYQNLGILFFSKGDYQIALDNFGEAETLRRTLASTNPTIYNVSLAATLNFQAIILSKMPDNNEVDTKKWQEAISLLKTYDISSLPEYAIKVGNYNAALGMRSINTEKIEHALLCFLDAEKAYRSVFDMNHPSKMFEGDYVMTLTTLGDIYSRNESGYAIAESKYKEAIEIGNWYCSSSEGTDITPLIYTYIKYGIYMHDVSRYKEAIRFFTSAIVLFEQMKERVANYDFINSWITFAYALCDDSLHRNAMEENDSDTALNISPQEALSKVLSLYKDILDLDENDLDYRTKCRTSFAEIIKYKSLLEPNQNTADVFFAYSKFLSDDYKFHEMIEYAVPALYIYEELISQNQKDYVIIRKYIELLQIYCTGLVELRSSRGLNNCLNHSKTILELVNGTEGDLAKTCLALKQLFILNFSVNSPKEDFEKSQQLIEGYRQVSSPETQLLLRFLLKAALCACEYEKWESAEKYINEAELLMNGHELGCIEERSSLGEIYSLKGRYLKFTQLKNQDNYAQYSYEKIMCAFNKAKKILSEGIEQNPVMFKAQLLDLDRSIMGCLRDVKSAAMFEISHICDEILKLYLELIEYDPVLFTWRAAEALLYAEEVWQELYLSKSKNQEELLGLYNKSLSVYDLLTSSLAVYKISWPDYYLKYSPAISEAKQRLQTNYRTKKDELDRTI